MIKFLLALILMPSLAIAAQPVPDAEISALANNVGRYTIGAWEGSLQGDLCLLTNSEPLNLAEFELSAPQGQDAVILRLTPARAKPLEGETVAVQVDGNEAQDLTYRSDEGGFAVALPAVQVTEMKSGRFITVGDYKFDLHGFTKAAALFSDCMKKVLLANLPIEQLAESDPVPTAGEWQLMTLKLGEYKYAGYAMLGTTELGLWVHNVDSFVLSLSGVDGITATTAKLNGQEVAAIAQKDGALIPLTPEQLRGLEEAQKLEIAIGAFSKSYEIKGFRETVVALQPYE